MVAISLVIICLFYYFNDCSLALANDTFDRFILVTQPMNFTTAEQHCQQFYGTHLATMLSISDVLQASSMCQLANLSCWFGLNDVQNEDSWMYTSGKLYEESVQDWYQMPGSRQPNGGYFQNCVIIWLDYDYAWNDYTCDHHSPFLCDIHTLNPTSQTIPPTKSPILTISPTPSPTITDRFILVNKLKNFPAAEMYCQNHYGTHLATILTPLDINQTKLLCQTSCWIGLWYSTNKTEWSFTSGRGFNWQVEDWLDKDSISLSYDEDSCVAIWSLDDFEWRYRSNFYCTYSELSFICDASTLSPTSQPIPPTPSPTVTDRFILVAKWMDFYDAESYCNKHYGTHLATITTQLDINHTKLMCQNAISWYNWGCWIGLRKIYNDRQLQWTFTSGRNLDNQVQDWRYPKPALYYSANCAAIRDAWEYRWDDYGCSYELPSFICDAHTFSPTTSAPTGVTSSPSQFPSRLPTSFTYSPTSISNSESINEEEVDIKWIIITILSVCIIVLIVLVIVICLITKWKDKRDAHSKHERIDNHNDDDDDLEMVQFKNVEVEQWLKDKCNLVQYVDNFVGNGYDTIELISNIDNIEELEEIEIALKGHQKMLLSEIVKLKQNEGQNEADGELGTLKS